MPINKQQFKRMTLFVAMLKENTPVTCASFKKRLEDNGIECTRRTILRDVQCLVNEYAAPIRYEAAYGRYVLRNPQWGQDFIYNAEDEALAMELGGRVAEDIFPEPLRTRIKTAVAFKLAREGTEELERAALRGISVSSKLKIPIEPEIFMPIFNGWRERRVVKITYKDANGKLSVRKIEPQALTFLDATWYVKAYCFERKAVRIFFIRRIQKAELLDTTFEPDQKLIGEIEDGALFNYAKARDVKILCDESLRDFIETLPFDRGQSLSETKEGRFTLDIPAVPEHEIIRWILSQGGLAELVAPRDLVAKIHEKAKTLLQLHRGSKCQ